MPGPSDPSPPWAPTPEVRRRRREGWIIAGIIVAVVLLAARLPWLGRLPGDIVVRRGPVTFYFPLLTCVVLSVVLTIVVNLFWRR